MLETPPSERATGVPSRRVEPDEVVACSDLGMYCASAGVAFEGSWGQAVDARDVVLCGGDVVVDQQACGAVNGSVEPGHLLKRCEQRFGGWVVVSLKFLGHPGQASAQPGSDGCLFPGVLQVLQYRGCQLPFGVAEHRGDLLQREAEAAQQADPVQPREVVGGVEPVVGSSAERLTE
jgi:hypothetical protein